MACYRREGSKGVTFLCGKLGPACSFCGWVSEFLCDFPVGDGKTCDRKMCADCAREVASDTHYCDDHYGMWRRFKDGRGVERELANVVPYNREKKGDNDG